MGQWSQVPKEIAERGESHTSDDGVPAGVTYVDPMSAVVTAITFD